MIKMVEPFVTYGYPSRQTVSKLIYKRGCGKVQRRRLPITDNSIIEGELGKHGIACVEDLIHEVVTCGPKFKEANNFLWPFKLSSPLGGFEIKRHSFAQGFGAFGNREELINAVVKKMIWNALWLKFEIWVTGRFANFKRRNAHWDYIYLFRLTIEKTGCTCVLFSYCLSSSQIKIL